MNHWEQDDLDGQDASSRGDKLSRGDRHNPDFMAGYMADRAYREQNKLAILPCKCGALHDRVSQREMLDNVGADGFPDGGSLDKPMLFQCSTCRPDIYRKKDNNG